MLRFIIVGVGLFFIMMTVCGGAEPNALQYIFYLHPAPSLLLAARLVYVLNGIPNGRPCIDRMRDIRTFFTRNWQ